MLIGGMVGLLVECSLEEAVSDGSLSDNELTIARFQGEHVAKIVKKLSA